MDVKKYVLEAACGVKVYLGKEKLEDLPKARAYFRRLRILDIFAKTLMTYWIAKKILSYLDVNLSIF